MNTLPGCQANTPGGLGGASGLRSCDFSSETVLGGSSSQDTGDPVPRPAASLGNKGCWPSGFRLTPRVSSALRGPAYGLAVTRACPPAGGDTRPQDARRTASVHDHTTLLQTMLTFEECHGGTQPGASCLGSSGTRWSKGRRGAGGGRPWLAGLTCARPGRLRSVRARAQDLRRHTRWSREGPATPQTAPSPSCQWSQICHVKFY